MSEESAPLPTRRAVSTKQRMQEHAVASSPSTFYAGFRSIAQRTTSQRRCGSAMATSGGEETNRSASAFESDQCSKAERLNHDFDVISCLPDSSLVVHEPRTRVDLTKAIENHRFDLTRFTTRTTTMVSSTLPQWSF